jgi:dephospho-CoA kinase
MPIAVPDRVTHVVGLTGGIGSGKSAVAERFASHGVPIIDTDAIAHELTACHAAAMPAIRAAFGDSVVAADGALDRTAMRKIVFADPVARKQLESVLHPLIRTECEQRIAALAGHAGYVILMVPLLIESGDYRRRVDRIAVVDCPEALQIARVMARNGQSRSEVDRVLAAQVRRADRLAAADDVIDNSTTLEALTARIQVLHQTYTKLFCAKG